MTTGVDRLDQALGQIRLAAYAVGSDLDTLAVPQLDALVRDLTATRARMDAVWMSVVAAVDRARVASRSGARDTAEFLTAVTGDRLGDSRRDVDLAAELEHADVVRDAFNAGDLSKAKAEALTKLRGASADQQAAMVERAKGQNLQQVREDVTRANHANRPSPPPPVVSRVRLRRDKDRLRVEAELNLVDGEWFDKALAAAGIDLELAADLSREQRMGEALIALSRHYLTSRPPTDTAPLSPANLYAVISYEDLATGTGSATLGSGAVIEAGAARRWACSGSVSRVLVDPASQILDLGRRSRLPTRGIAEALLLDDGGCRFGNCPRPPWGCEAHHVQFWANNGDTDLDNLVLLCWYHHHLIHADDGWQLTLHRDRALTITYRGRHIATTTPRGRARNLAAAHRGGAPPGAAPAPSAESDPSFPAPLDHRQLQLVPLAGH